MSENTNVEAAEIQEEAVVTAEEPAVVAEESVAVAVEPAAPVKAKKVRKVKKPWPAPVKVLMGFIAFILCVVMFVVSFAGVAILNLRAIVSENGITQIISQLIAGTPSTSSTRPVLAGGADGFVIQGNSSAEMSGMLVDWAYEMIQSEFGEELEITKEQVQTFVENSTVKDFVAEKTTGLVEDFYAGTYETTITPEEITGLIQENAPLLEEQFGLVITEEEISFVEEALEESGVLDPIQENGLMGFIEEQTKSTYTDEETGEVIEVDGMQEVKEIMEIVRTVTSVEAVAILGGVFLLLMALVFLVTRFSFPATLADTGVVLTLVGLIFSAPANLCQNQPEVLLNLFDGEAIAGVISSIILSAAWVNYTVLGVGAAMIVAAVVIKILQSKQKKAVA